MTLQPIQDLWFFVKGAYEVCASNFVLSIPIALSVIYYAFKLYKRISEFIRVKGG